MIYLFVGDGDLSLSSWWFIGDTMMGPAPRCKMVQVDDFSPSVAHGRSQIISTRRELAGENRVPFSKEDFREARTNVLLKYTDCDASRLQVKRHRPVKVKSDAVA